MIKFIFALLIMVFLIVLLLQRNNKNKKITEVSGHCISSFIEIESSISKNEEFYLCRQKSADSFIDDKHSFIHGKGSADILYFDIIEDKKLCVIYEGKKKIQTVHLKRKNATYKKGGYIFNIQKNDVSVKTLPE